MLNIENLSCGYDSKIVLRNIDLNINKGELVGIIGPNGSGKTTLLKSITHLVKPKTGKIFFEAQDVSKMGFKELARNIAVVSQNLETPAISVEDFVLLGRIPYYGKFQFWESQRDLDIARENMALTHTLQFKDQLLDEISGGEKQLCFMARALTQTPKLLLLDEPTAHLDITHQVRTLDLIKKLNKDFSLSVIMVLHDLNLASEYCAKLILLNQGKIYKTGEPQEVLTEDNIQAVYKTKVSRQKNPFSSKPYVIIISEQQGD